MLVAYWRRRVVRLDTRRVGRIEFEEMPDTVVQVLLIGINSQSQFRQLLRLAALQ